MVLFGQEDMNKLGDAQLKYVLNQGYLSIPALTEKVHFNKSIPEYQNVYISNMRDKYVMIYNNNDWSLEERDPVIEQLYTDKRDFLIEKYDELKKELPKYTIKKFDRFIRDLENKEVITNTKQEIRLILYNNRKIPENTRHLLGLDESEDILGKLLKDKQVYYSFIF